MRPYLRVANVFDARIDTTDVLSMNFTPVDYEHYRLVPGDVLLNEGQSRELVGRPAIYRGEVPGACFQNTLLRFQAEIGIAPEWALTVFRNYLYDGTFRSIAQWTTNLAHLGSQRFALLDFPVAPTNQQRRIVEALDLHLTRLDAAADGLKRAAANLKRYRASVLKSAVEGRLVPTEAELAKKEGRHYEPASVLLSRILKERRRRWEESELAKMKAKGQVLKGDKWKEKYEEPVPPDMTTLPELPEGWCWTTVDQLSWDSGYGTSIRCEENAQGTPVLRIPNVADAKVDLSDLKYATQDLRMSVGDEVSPHDFLMIRTNGSRALIGRAAYVPITLPSIFSFASYLIRFRFALNDATAVVGHWLSCFWQAPETRVLLERKAATSAGQYNLSMSGLSGFAIPLPPESEMTRACEAIDNLLSIANAAAASVTSKKVSLARLRQSILKWAFEGKLVDQDPNDEPASVLLDRIRAERAATSESTRFARGRKKKES